MISVRHIQETVAADFGVPMERFLSPCREREVCRPRQYAMLLARELTPHSVTVLGKLFDRDHSTVSTGVRSAQKIVAVSPDIALKLGARALLLTSEPEIAPVSKIVGFASRQAIPFHKGEIDPLVVAPSLAA
jgi:hypothetical protein